MNTETSEASTLLFPLSSRVSVFLLPLFPTYSSCHTELRCSPSLTLNHSIPWLSSSILCSFLLCGFLACPPHLEFLLYCLKKSPQPPEKEPTTLALSSLSNETPFHFHDSAMLQIQLDEKSAPPQGWEASPSCILILVAAFLSAQISQAQSLRTTVSWFFLVAVVEHPDTGSTGREDLTWLGWHSKLQAIILRKSRQSKNNPVQ